MIKNVYFLYNYSINRCGRIDPEAQKCKQETKTIWRLRIFQLTFWVQVHIFYICFKISATLLLPWVTFNSLLCPVGRYLLRLYFDKHSWWTREQKIVLLALCQEVTVGHWSKMDSSHQIGFHFPWLLWVTLCLSLPLSSPTPAEPLGGKHKWIVFYTGA